MNPMQEKLRAIAGLQRPGTRTIVDHEQVKPLPPAEPVRSARAAKDDTHARRGSPEHRQKMSAIMKASWQSPTRRARQAARMKEKNSDPDFKARQTRGLIENAVDPEFRSRTSQGMKAVAADPAFRRKASERMKAMHADPEFHARASRAGAENLKRWRAAKKQASK